jgi:hypothetical protein
VGKPDLCNFQFISVVDVDVAAAAVVVVVVSKVALKLSNLCQKGKLNNIKPL